MVVTAYLGYLRKCPLNKCCRCGWRKIFYILESARSPSNSIKASSEELHSKLKVQCITVNLLAQLGVITASSLDFLTPATLVNT